MAKAEYLLLAQNYRPGKDSVSGWFVSEKLDGCRALWDGGVSRGRRTTDIGYANVVKDTKPVLATGLWSRTGKVIHAPDSWLDRLPKCCLDGELYLGPGRFQELRTIIGPHVPDESRWREVDFKIFDAPSWSTFTAPREIKVRNDYSYWIRNTKNLNSDRDMPYDLIYLWLTKVLANNSVIKQEQLPFCYHEAVAVLEHKLKIVTDKGGEGLMLRNPSFRWSPVRSNSLLKYKPYRYAEAKIIGFTTGRGRLLGRIGALVVEYNGQRLELSGMTDEERVIFDDDRKIAAQSPGTDYFNARAYCFTIGQIVRFKYRELSDSGIPKEARYTRGIDS